MRIAFVKFCGLVSGGIEKYLQTIAILFRQNGHQVDYYYTNNCPFTDGHIHALYEKASSNFLKYVKYINL